MQLINGFSLANLKGDIYGGITAAVVALPLALAFGVASGAGAIAGLYGAILVGFFAALFGGTPSQVSGPTAPMTVVMTGVVMQYAGHPAEAFTVVMTGGLLQIVFGWLKLGRYVTYVPFSVISGFMSGIGCIIIVLQLLPLFGFTGSSGGVIGALAKLPNVVSHPVFEALIVGLLALAIMLFMPGRLRRLILPPLAALVISTLIGIFVLSGAPVIGEIPRGLPDLQIPAIELERFPGMVQAALVLAVLGSIDSLLTSLIADNVTRTQHKSNRKLIGQGIGNVIAGLLGGIPGAGATMRTVVNVRAGGRTPISGALHSLVLLALVLGLAPLAEGIPLAVLAGTLLKVGWDIVDWDFLRRVRRAPRSEVIVMLTVLALTVFVDLVTAVGVGIIMASLVSASRLSEVQLSQLKFVSSHNLGDTPLTPEERDIFERAGNRLLLLHLSGPFSFCSARDMIRRMSVQGAGYDIVLLDMSDVSMIDTSIAMAINELVEQARHDGRDVVVAGDGEGQVARDLSNLKVLDRVPKENRFNPRLAAMRHVDRLLAEQEPEPEA